MKLAQFLRSFLGVPQLRHTAIYRGALRSQGLLISSPINPNNQLEFDAVVQCKREAIITMCVCACSNKVYSFAYIYFIYSHDLHLYLLYTIRHGNIRSILHSYMFCTLFFLHNSESNTFINANSPAFLLVDFSELPRLTWMPGTCTETSSRQDSRRGQFYRQEFVGCDVWGDRRPTRTKTVAGNHRHVEISKFPTNTFWGICSFLEGTVDGSEIPRPTSIPVVNNGINYQPQLVSLPDF